MMTKETFKISGMTCAACSARIERVLNRESGIEEVSVNLVMEKGTVTYDPDRITRDAIFERISKIGFEAHPLESQQETRQRQSNELKRQKYKFIIAFVLALPLLYTMFAHFDFLSFVPVPKLLMNPWFQLLLATPIQFVLGAQFYIGAYKSLIHKSANMDVLVAMGTSTAYFYSIYLMIIHGHMSHHSIPLYFETSAVLITLILLGKYFEKRAKGHASDAIEKLAALQVKDAEVERNGKIEQIAIDQVRVGDTVLIRSGQHIPLDGEIIEGDTTIDESLITGESIPVEKSVGDRVIGSTLNQTNFIKIRVTHVGEDLVLNQIIKVVEDAQNEKPHIQRLADQISNVFVPAVVGIAILAFLIWYMFITPQQLSQSLEIFIAVIVIACPCALGLATPTSIMVGSGRAAKTGILFKSAEALEQTKQTDTIVFDKTGTLTNGRPKVMIEHILSDDTNVPRYVKSLEQQSEHPLSHALIDYYEGVKTLSIEQYQTHTGNGISGRIDGAHIHIGSISFLEPIAQLSEDIHSIVQNIEEQGATVVGVVVDGQLMTIFGLRDEPKEDAKSTVESLKQNYELILLSGDSENTAQAIANQLGIQRVIAGVKPEEKAHTIKALQSQGKIVMMIGDGVNDAPALMQSNIGVAMGSGSDIALESSDIALVKNQLKYIPEALKLSRLTIRNIKQNLFFAFIYNLIGIPIAASGFLAPWLAGTAMAFSSVSVVLNALRLNSIQK
ncbi:heavy metal translocating P-type ATPase [Staphylococcus felis]|nr:heavy metal translocating P-type ATPase [Staphylococcus felis]REI20884.1 heavy metal translocating P-type ATPase [Staphylococcus felis]REI21425.1 heavy metal translocating P-type ATPase [Staphylococcus felis]REI33258.1 heavy metal translocating P-type ATPase [Staphylococcus felis]